MGLSTRTLRRLAERSRLRAQGPVDRLLSWDPDCGAQEITNTSPEAPGTNTDPTSPHIARAYLLFLMQRLGKGNFLDRLRGVASLSRKQLENVDPEWKAWLASQKKRSA